MILKLWTANQLPRLHELKGLHQIPDKVISNIKSYIDILDASYGSTRKITDDGGYIMVILPESDDSTDCDSIIKKTLDFFHLTPADAEFQEIIAPSAPPDPHWFAELYLISNDYGIIFIYSKHQEL